MGMEETELSLTTILIDPDRFPVALMAIALVTVIGMMRGALGGNAQPFFWHIMEILFGSFGDKMNKPDRLKGDLIFRGFLLTSFGLVVAFMIGSAFELLTLIFPHYSIVEVIALSLCLTCGALFAGIGQLYKALNKSDVTQGAYYTIARTTQTNMSQSDDFAITRVGIGMLLKGFDKGLVAPVIWYLLTGLVGAYLYAGLAALSWRFGKEGFGRGFGHAPMALERLMGFVTSMYAGVLILLGNILTPTASLSRGFKGVMSSKMRAPYGQGGMPMTSAAWGLNISIGGPSTDIEGSAIKREWVGPLKATAQLQAKHLHRAAYLTFMALILFVFSIVGAMLFASMNLTEGVELDFIPKIGASMLDLYERIRLMFAQN